MNWTQHINRRTCLQLISGLGISMVALTESLADLTSNGKYKCLPGKVKGPSGSLGDGIDTPFNWPYFTLQQEGANRVRWKKFDAGPYDHATLRISCATDLREETIVEVLSAKKREKLGEMDIRFAHYMQPFGLPLTKIQVKTVIKEGVRFRLIKGDGPVWFFRDGKQVPAVFSPHLLLYNHQGDPEAWQDRLISLDSIQRFGWMEGVSLDGLYAAFQFYPDKKKVETALQEHIHHFFDGDELSYLCVRNRPCNISNIGGEDSLPFATIAKVWPECPALDGAVQYFKHIAEVKNLGTGKEIIADSWLSTEGCYTQAYPAASIAKARDDREMAAFSIASLLARRDHLTDEKNIYQKAKAHGEKYYRNWVRGVAWYLLGIERSLECLPGDLEGIQALKTEFERAVEIAVGFQRHDGLWTSIMDEPDTGVDTSGTTGVAAAIALGVKNGFLPPRHVVHAQSTWDNLSKGYFTPDGFLKGSCQENKGGLALQKSGYRAISPYTLGFVGLLKAGLQ